MNSWFMPSPTQLRPGLLTREGGLKTVPRAAGAPAAPTHFDLSGLSAFFSSFLRFAIKFNYCGSRLATN